MAIEDGSAAAHRIRHEPQEKPPHVLAAAMAAQTVLLILAGIMLTPLVIARGAGASDDDASWMVFAALFAAGISTWLQLIRKGWRGPQDRVTVPLSPRAVPSLNETVARFARRVGWDQAAENRLMLAVEEAVIFLWEEREAAGGRGNGKLVVRLKEHKGEAEVEMVTGPSERNLEELIADAAGAAPANDADTLTIRLLARVTRELKHLQYTRGGYLQFRVDSSA